MKLYYAPASPFARKCRVIAHELSIKLELVALTPPYGTPEFRRINPLGKIPALVLDDGSALIDSPVICEYLNQYGSGKFFPGLSIWRPANGRWKALGLQALGDGIADAAVARVIEGRQDAPHQAAIERHMAAVNAGFDACERITFAEHPTIGEVAVGCAIGYVDFRLADLGWRASRPKLAAWYERFSNYSAMKATAPA